MCIHAYVYVSVNLVKDRSCEKIIGPVRKIRLQSVSSDEVCLQLVRLAW